MDPSRVQRDREPVRQRAPGAGRASRREGPVGRAERRRGRGDQPRGAEGRLGLRADELPPRSGGSPVRHRQLRRRRRAVRCRAGVAAGGRARGVSDGEVVAGVPDRRRRRRTRAGVGGEPRRARSVGIHRRTRPRGRRPDGWHDHDLHVGHDREAEGDRPPYGDRGSEQWRLAVGADRRMAARRHLPDDGAALSLGSARVHVDRAGPRRVGRRAAPLRSRGLAPPRRSPQGVDVVLRPDTRTPHRRPARRRAGEVRHVVDAAADRERRALAVRAEEEVRRADQRLVAVRGVRVRPSSA